MQYYAFSKMSSKIAKWKKGEGPSTAIQTKTSYELKPKISYFLKHRTETTKYPTPRRVNTKNCKIRAICTLCRWRVPYIFIDLSQTRLVF